MHKFLNKLWNVITFPFRWLGNLIARPFRAIHRYMNAEPNSRAILDTMAVLAQEDEARQSLIDHIEKFRRHLLRSLVALGITTTAGWFFAERITEFLAVPIGGTQALQIIDPTEGVGVYMKVAFMAGFSIGILYIAFEFWAYAAPGLTPQERWTTLLGIPVTAFLFALGVVFTYYFMLPTAIDILLKIGNFTAGLTADKYFTFVTRLLFWIGIFFEFPLVTTILTRVGVITPRKLLSQWRVAIVAIGVIAAVITPTTDPGSMALVMAPMIVLYFISIGLSFFFYRKKKEQPPVNV